ncbi:putative disease resistance protein At3g14460 [Arachis hypogaea]|uniref:putative disease resistance protein At3g14460 n=1 Tax=Arachis hypogaea TaxID=3818 RepID=UPI000DEC3B2E|nr:putative disease resistance RPP13-like protein 1 [Arachis hypogaea]
MVSPSTSGGLGSLLRTINYDERDWDSVLKSELREVFEDQNDEIIPALRISYHYLPSNLKRCFVYCSLFPKDYEFDKGELVLLWMAEELLQPKGKKSLEELGCEYFDQLVARSFFQSSSTDNSFYVIHDIMHDLATIYAGEFYFRAKKLEKNNRISNKTRHLLHNSRGNYPCSQLVVACGRTLPEELCTLYNLQTLKLNKCRWLMKLPNNMQDLVNLRHIDIEGAGLEEMPKGISKMRDLQFLRACLENVIDGDQALEARMAEKKNIRSLYLTWSSDNDTADSQDIINNLRPHTNLRELSINEYMGQTFPNWLGHSSFRNMTKIYLKCCSNCFELPSVGQLPSLKHLQLNEFNKLTRVGAKFNKDDESSFCGTPFPMLKTLCFSDMYCWEEWLSVSSEFELDAFPWLRVLTMRNCPLLRGDLPSQLPALKSIRISQCAQLAFTLPRVDAMLKLSVEGPHQVEAVFEAIARNQLNCLQSLRISRCYSSISFPGACLPFSLQNLEILGCPYLEFPMSQKLRESLQSVSIFDSCFSLVSFPLASFPNLTALRISSCN